MRKRQQYAGVNPGRSPQISGLKEFPERGPELPRKGRESGLMGLCREIAGTLVRRYVEEPDGEKVRDEVRAVLAEKLQCGPKQAHGLIGLALELIHLNCYGNYRRDDLEMSLLVSQASGQVGEVDRN